MKLLRRLVLVVLMAATLPVSAGPAGENAQISVTVVAANREDAPLQILGFKLPEKVGDPPRIVLHNVSSKLTTRIWIEALIGSLDENGEVIGADNDRFIGTNSNGPNSQWPEERAIPPQGTGEARETVLEPHRLAFSAGRVRSNCLYVAAIVLRVEFADGTVWTSASLEKMRQMWKDALRTGAVSCAHRPGVEETLRRLEGSGYEKTVGTPTHADAGVRQSYSSSCSLRQIRGKLMAVCPF